MTPLLLGMLLGAIELGRYAYISILVSNAARAGAAYATEHLSNAGKGTAIEQAAKNDYQNNGQNPNNLTVTPKDVCGCDNGSYPIATATCDPGSGTPPTCAAGSHWVVIVIVTASGTYKALFNYPWIQNPITITKKAEIQSPLN